MINIFEALGWLNAVDNYSYLPREARRLSRAARLFNPSDGVVRRILERLQGLGRSSPEPLERGEIFLHCAAIENWRGWFTRSARHAQEAVAAYKKDEHRRAVAFWILGMAQWKLCKNRKACDSWTEAKKIFQHQQFLFQHMQKEADWYKNAVWRMEVDLAVCPEEIATWLNHFERTSLRAPSEQIVNCMQEKLCQQAYPTVYALMQDFQEANKCCTEAYERAEISLEFGLAVYQMGGTHFSIQLLRKSVENFYPGIGTYHKQVVARCMLGALEWMDTSCQKQAAADWMRCMDEFDKLRQWAERDNMPAKKKWYAERRDILRSALLEKLPENKPRREEPEESIDPPPSPQSDSQNRYRYLLLLLQGNAQQAERLIAEERQKFPHESRQQIVERVIEHLLRSRQ